MKDSPQLVCVRAHACPCVDVIPVVAAPIVLYKCNGVMKIHDESMLTALATLGVPQHE